jgi:hypothetical protein
LKAETNIVIDRQELEGAKKAIDNYIKQNRVRGENWHWKVGAICAE